MRMILALALGVVLAGCGGGSSSSGGGGGGAGGGTLPPPTTPADPSQCVAVTPCHGLDSLACGPSQACTEEYRMGDFCRQYLSCEMQNEKCALVRQPKFEECVNCFDSCKGGDQNACDQQCREQLGAGVGS